MIQGLRSAIYPAKDLAAAKAWYGAVLGVEPYFDQPFYVGYTVGGFELGLVPDGTPGSHGVQAYWGVPDAEAELKRLVELGARVFEEVRDVGGGIKVASVEDPFGNTFSIVENPHFDAASVR
ncbi:VOC family protein [Isosphaeraceae bacterium EP7]